MMKRILVTLVAVLTFPVLSSCALGQRTPTVTAQDEARALGERMINEANFGLTIIDGARPLINLAPGISAARKNEIRCDILKGSGRPALLDPDEIATLDSVCGVLPTNDQSPLLIAARELRNITNCASLRVVVERLNSWLDPFVKKLEMATESEMRFLALTLRTGMFYTLSLALPRGPAADPGACL